MFPRRSGHDDKKEPDVISSEAARLSEGRRPGRRLALASGNDGLGSHEAGPHPSRPSPADQIRHAYNLEGESKYEESKARLKSHAGGRHNHRAPKEDGSADAQGAPGGCQSSSRKCQPQRAENSSDGAEPKSSYPNNVVALRHKHAAKREESEAPGPRPRQREPTGRAHEQATRNELPSSDNGRYGGLRRGGGYRARERHEDNIDDSDHGTSQVIVERGGRTGPAAESTHGNGDSHQLRRYIPYSFATLPKDYLGFLKGIFKVRSSKVENWCDDELIRLDRDSREGDPVNIDPLLAQMPEKDREAYENVIRRLHNEREIIALTGKDPRKEILRREKPRMETPRREPPAWADRLISRQPNIRRVYDFRTRRYVNIQQSPLTRS